MTLQAKKRLCAQRAIEEYLTEEIFVEKNLLIFTLSFTGMDAPTNSRIDIENCPDTEELTRIILGLEETLGAMEDCPKNYDCFSELIGKDYGTLLETAYEGGYDNVTVLAAIFFKMAGIFVPEIKEMIKGNRLEIHKHYDVPMGL